MSEFIHVIKDWIEHLFMWITELGYWGIMLGLMIEVIPSEIVLAFGGYLVSQGNITFTGAVIFGTIGGTIAQIFVYWIGRYGGRPFLEKYGKYIFIHKKQIDLSEKWFNQYGTGVIFTARFIPVVRHAISIPAGIAKMSLLRFTILTTLAVIPWSVFFIYLGWSLGDNWQEIDEKAKPYIIPFIIGALILLGIYFVYKFFKRKRANVSDTIDFFAALEKPYSVLQHKTNNYMVIGPNGIFYIDMTYGSGEMQNDAYTMEMYRYQYFIKEQLRDHNMKSDILSIFAVDPTYAKTVPENPEFLIIALEEVVDYIKSYKAKRVLTQAEIGIITNILK